MRIRAILRTGLWVLSLSASLPLAADDSRLELTDGSVLLGEVVGFADGSYVIETATLGRVRVPQSRIVSIRPCAGCGGTSAPAGAASVSINPAEAADPGATVADLQRRMAADAGTMASLQALQNDPAVRAVLEDPALMRRIQSFDVEGLEGDPRLEALMRHPEIRALIEAYGR